jgi:hypothetical protein
MSGKLSNDMRYEKSSNHGEKSGEKYVTKSLLESVMNDISKI